MVKDLTNIPLKISYDSGIDDVLWDFYIPVLSRANSYDRIAGFFSSSSLALAARGMEEFISKGGSMRLVTCPHLQPKDIEMIQKNEATFDDVFATSFIKDYSEIENQFQKDHVKALGWMLANHKLEIKIAIIRKGTKLCSAEEVEESGIMHQKVGIFRDSNGNILSFSGSNNESASGWLGNTEEFKVFCSWKGAIPYIEDDVNKFNGFWYGVRPDVEIKTLPEAVKEHLLTESKTFEPSALSIRKYYPEKLLQDKKPLKLFYYQKDAVEKWEANNRNLLLQMATGCGKTRTAIGCVEKALKDTKKLLVIIACPQVTLSAQWRKDISGLDVGISHEIVINGNVPGWQSHLNREIKKLSTGLYNHLVVYTTHQICSSDKYLEVVANTSGKVIKFFVGDEVHGMGAEKTRRGLISEYDYRLGLSATPQRWFDDEGSALIESYFGDDSFEFSIEDALTNHNPLTGKTFLVNYSYIPCFINMTDHEMQDYKELTEKIVRTKNIRDENEYDFLQRMRFERANIEKNAENKYFELKKILDDIGNAISDTIIFVSDAQINRVMSILGERGIIAARFTKDQGTTPMEKFGGISEREYIIKLFKEKKYQVLVAIKCLDEGIDIPSADCAIVMASSTNPREYVQRIGRIIRQAPGKYRATIYDMIIKPELDLFKDSKIIELEKRIFRKEMDRVQELSQNAINNSDVLNAVYDVLWEVSE